MKKIPAHQWTNENGEVLILRFSDKNGKSYNGFQHPMTVGESVVEPKWNEAAVCGGGIHGWPWGIGLGEGKECEWESLWQVYGAKPEEVVGEIEGGQKCKFKTGTLRFLGKWDEAMKFILSGQIKWVEQWAGEKHATGDRGRQVRQFSDGLQVRQFSDGRQVRQFSDGLQVRQFSDGRQVRQFSDGLQVRQFSDGQQFRQFSDGLQFRQFSDGQSVRGNRHRR